MSKEFAKNKLEKGGAGVNLAIIMVVLILAGNAAYQYILTAYSGESIKQEMQAAVLQGLALPPSAGDPVKVTKARIEKIIASNDAPADAFVEVKLNKNTMQARVAYTKKVNLLPFGIYQYDYNFDYTAVPNGFLTRE
jgi:hypothetical protein